MNEIIVLSCSWGRDSLALLLKELREPSHGQINEVVTVMTGMEFPQVLEMRDKALREELLPRGIRYTEIPFPVSFAEMMISQPVYHKDGTKSYGRQWCNTNGVRWGTGEKLRLLRKHIADTYPRDAFVRELIGIAANESDRCITNDPHKTYPLVTDYHMTESECLDYCYKAGYCYSYAGPDMETRYLYWDICRASCFCCGAKRISEIRAIYSYMPELFDRLKGLQRAVGLDKPMMVKQGYTVFDLEEKFRAENEERSRQVTMFDLI